MANYKLNENGYIQNPEKKTNDDIYKVEILKDTLTISLPHIEDYVNAMNEARDYKSKYLEIKEKFERITPQLQKDKAMFESILSHLKYLSRESQEYSGVRKFIMDIENILKFRN